jgi:hypothetical protein
LLTHLAKSGSKNFFGLEVLYQIETNNPNTLNHPIKRLVEMEIIGRVKRENIGL